MFCLNRCHYHVYLYPKSTVIWGNLDQFSTLTLRNSIENCFLFLEKIAITSSISIVYAPDFWKLFENSKLPKNFKNLLNSSNPILGEHESRVNSEKRSIGYGVTWVKGSKFLVMPWRLKAVFPSISIHKARVRHLINLKTAKEKLIFSTSIMLTIK